MKTNKLNFKTLSTFFCIALVSIAINVSEANSVTWLGGDASTPNSWKDSKNWNTGSTPGSQDDVTIPSTINNPTTDATSSIGSLTISGNGATLTLDGTHNLTIAGNVIVLTSGSQLLTGKGTIIIGGSISGQGKLDLTGNGTAEIAGNMSIRTFVPGPGGKSLVIFYGISQNICNSYQFNNLQVGISSSTNISFLADQAVNVAISGSGTLNCGNHTLNLMGDMTVKTFMADSGTVNLTGLLNFQSQDINGYTFYNLSVNNTKTYLSGNVCVGHNLDFMSGDILLRSYNLTILPGATMTWEGIFTPDCTNGYVVTCGTGHLTMSATSNGTIYPIGYSMTEYNPVTITAGSIVALDVSVADGVTDGVSNAITSNAVSETWLIVPNVATSIIVTTQWTDGSEGDVNQELPFFNRALAEINERTTQTDPSPWTTIGPVGQATGGDPWGKNSGPISMLANASYYLYVNAGSIAPLPVTLTSFDAECQNGEVNLSWITASEINNNRFEIERSINGTDWATIAIVNGHGTTQEGHAYSSTDNLEGLVATETIYYRLKQVDFNGDFSYSMIRPVNITDISAPIAFYPNPVRDHLNITWTSPVGANTIIRILNTNGLTLYNVTKTGSGIMHEQIDLGGYPVGSYIVQVACNAMLTSKLVSKE